MSGCWWCGAHYSAGAPHQRYCSAKCRNASNRAPRSSVHFGFCECCGRCFAAKIATAAVCSADECKREQRRRINRELERRYFSEHGEYRSRAIERANPNHRAARSERDRKRNEAVPYRQRYPEQAHLKDERRRMRKYGNGGRAEPFDRRAIFERDGWVCQLCFAPVDPDLRYPNRQCASLDHIVPLAHGGEHVEENVQLAHVACNVARRDMPLEEFRERLKLAA